MNRRQKRERLNYFKNQEKILAERKVRELRDRQEMFADAWHRDWVLERWDERREFRRLRDLDRPKGVEDSW